MKYNNKLTYILSLGLIIVFLFYISVPSALMAQGVSYLDTIYKAVEGSDKAISSDYKAIEVTTDAKDTPGEDEGTEIIFSKPTDTDNTETGNETDTDTGTDTGKENSEIAHINEVFNNMTRILIGMNMGVNINTSSFSLISLDDSSDTDTGSQTSSSSDTDTGSQTSSGSDTDSDTDTGSQTSSSSDTDSDTDTGSQTGSDSDTDTGSQTGSDSDTGSSTDTGSQTQIETDIETGTDSETKTGTDTGTSVSEETEDDLKSKINSLYGIKCTDGENAFTLRQLQLIDGLLGKLKEADSEETDAFINATTEIIRDSNVPDDFNSPTIDDNKNVSAYVNNTETKIHVLNRATYITQEEIDKLKEKYPNVSFTDTKLRNHLESSFAQTIAHEMTHCFQHSEAKKGNDVIASWQDKFWQSETQIKTDGLPPSDYAKTAPYEDMAECVGYYIMGGIITKNSKGQDVYRTSDGLYAHEMDLERYNYIKNNIFGGVEFSDEAPSNGGISI